VAVRDGAQLSSVQGQGGSEVMKEEGKTRITGEEMKN